MTNWIDVLQASFYSLWNEIIGFLPEFIIAIVIVIVGWIVGNILKHIVIRIFDALRINQLLTAAGAEKLAVRAGYSLRAGVFVGLLIKWFTIIVFIVAALDVLNLEQVTVFFREVVLGYLPQVIVAVLILFAAMIIANVVDKSIVAGARASNFASPEVLGNFARYAILVFAVLAALSHLGIAPDLVKILFTGFVFASSLALGIAFGLGGRESAARYLERFQGKNRME